LKYQQNIIRKSLDSLNEINSVPFGRKFVWHVKICPLSNFTHKARFSQTLWSPDIGLKLQRFTTTYPLTRTLGSEQKMEYCNGEKVERSQSNGL